MLTEIRRDAASGYPYLLFGILLVLGGAVLLVGAMVGGRGWGVAVAVSIMLLALLPLTGLFMVHPNQARVLTLFGAYKGTVHDPGLRWANPFYDKRRISVRVRNFESDRIKVNDCDGNPIEIATVVVWKVVDTVEACFEVDDYADFVHVQSESALRNLATGLPYDSDDEARMALRSHTHEVAERLRDEVQDRLQKAGVEVLEARITHLAYAPEIASAMLQRQQAGAIIAARQRIVDGAVGMVEMALERLSQGDAVRLDEAQKAAMVSNLLVVLCGERATQPVVQAGTSTA